MSNKVLLGAWGGNGKRHGRGEVVGDCVLEVGGEGAGAVASATARDLRTAGSGAVQLEQVVDGAVEPPLLACFSLSSQEQLASVLHRADLAEDGLGGRFGDRRQLRLMPLLRSDLFG